MSPEDSFHQKYTIDTKTKCWNWNKPVPSNGYGYFYFNGKSTAAHRVSHILFKGPIPQGFTIDHLCRNHACVNPIHLEAVTIAENVLRGEGITAKQKRQTHCLRGHPLSGANMRRDKWGRVCIRCKRIRAYGREEKIQVIKTYSFKGRTLNLSEWCKELNVKKATLYMRIEKYKWPVERALTETIRTRNLN